MSNPKDGRGKSGERPAGGASSDKRPHATLDLKAVEVPSSAKKPETPEPPKAATAPPGKGASSTATPSQAGAATKAGAAGAASQADKHPAETEKAKAGKTDTAPAAKTTATPPPRGGSTFGSLVSHLVAGVVGGAIVLYAAPHLTPMLRDAGLPPPPPAEPSPQVMQRLAGLEQGLNALPRPDPANDPAKAIAAASANGARIEEIAKAVAALRSGQTRLEDLTSGIEAKLAKEPPIADSAARIVKLEQRLAELAAVAETEPKNAGRIQQLASITGRLGDLDVRVTSEVQQARKDMLREIETRIQPATEASEAARAGTQRLDRELAGVKSEQNRISTNLDQVKTAAERVQLGLKATDDTAARLDNRINAVRRELENRLQATAKPADVSSAIAPVASKLTSLETNLASVVKSEAERQATAERIVLALELGNLKRSIERGVPFARELSEVKKASGADINLAPLEPYASKGLPTMPELSRRFHELSGAMIDADRASGDDTVVDRLLSGAKAFVRVRKTSHAPSDTSVEAVVGRIDTALKNGRLQDVLKQAAELKTVPPAARKWLAEVKARATVDAALANIDQALKSSLGAGPTSGDQQKAKP
ncbi:MAG: hypothetical protein ACK5JT_07505 [Hyphomicrobiaceae bacterium]